MANLVSSLLTPYTHMVSSPVNYAEASHRHCFAFVFVVQPLNCVWLFETLWTAVHQASLSITIFQSLLKFMSIESVIPSNHLIFCHPLLLLPSIFPIIRVFSNESAVGIRWPKYWSFTFSINPSKAWFPLILLVWSPCCPKDSQEFSPALQFESINSSALCLLYGPVLTSIHDYWKDHSLDYKDLCQQSDVFTF